MQLWQVIIAVITGIISIGSIIVSCVQAKGKGPVFTNAYLFASKENREKIDKKYEYRLARNVFFLLGLIFALLTLCVLTGLMWLLYPIHGLIFVLLVYVIVKAVKNGEFK